MKRNLQIDFLKNLACLGVVALHIFNPSKCSNIIYYVCVAAIPIFFMVNGFLILNKKEITYKYVLKKIINMVVIILIWNILLFLQQIIVQHNVINPIKETIRNLVQRGTFFQFWFLGSLIMIYIFLPIIHKILNRSEKVYKFVIVLCLMICFTIDIINIIFGLMGKEIFTAKIIQTFRLWTWITYFIIGGYIGKYKKEIKSTKKDKIIFFIVMIITLGYQLFISKYVFNNWRVENFYDNIIIMMYIILLWKIVYSIKIEKISGVIDINVKNIMGIYIVHPLIINAVGSLYNYNNILINIMVYIFVLIICILVSTLINKIPKLNRIVNL